MKKDVYIAFSAGVGPTECAIACEKVFKTFVDEHDNCNLRVIQYEDDYTTGFRSVHIIIPNLDEEEITKLKDEWEGSVRFIATKNSVREHHKRKNWFVGVHIYELPETINYNEKDIKIDRFRSSGPGGQHVNKTESAVRITHIPTQIVVTCDAERDQIQNLRIAKKLLAAKIDEYNKFNFNKFGKIIWEGNKNVMRGMAKRIIKGEL